MVDRDFGHWLAGFIDGEGCFYITRDSARGVCRARFSLSVRNDDAPILDEIHRATGLGTRHKYVGQSGHPVARWMVQSYADCDALASLLRIYPLRAKKRQDFQVWERALVAQKRIRPGRADNSQVIAALETLKNELTEVRRSGL